MTNQPKRPLNARQSLFAAEYLIDLNATQAAIRAGYAPKRAYAMGHENLRKPEIIKAIQVAMGERMTRTGVTADRVILELERMALFDPKDLTAIRSPEDIDELPEDVRRCITGWSWDKAGNFVVKMAKEKALEMLGRHHKLFTDRVEVEETDTLAVRLKEARERIKEG